VLQLKRRLVGQPVYYGWVLAWMLGPAQLVTWGILYYTFAVMLAPMQAELGWSTAELTGAFSLALLAGGVAAVPAGRWLDRRGPHRMMTLGVLASALLVLGWSQVHALPAFYAIWLMLGVLSAAVLYDPAMWVIARWFSGHWRDRRGRALTVLTFFGGLASTVFIPLSSALQQTYGWRSALVVLAGMLVASTVIPYALLLKPRAPDETGSHAATGAQPPGPAHALTASVGWRGALRRRSFWQLAGAFALTAMTWSALSIHLIAYALSRGQAAALVAVAAGMVGVMQVIGRLTLVPLSDRMTPHRIATALCVLQAAAPAALLILPPLPGLAVYVVTFGVGHGAMTPMRTSIVADTFGVDAFGGISGALTFITTLLRAVAPVAAGLAVATFGGYDQVLVAAVAASLAGAVLMSRAS
jgi:MFS family permease